MFDIKSLILISSAFLLLSCTSNGQKFHRVVKTESISDSSRLPSSENGSFDLSSVQLVKMKPVEVLEYLKNDCCDSRLVETTEIKNIWTEEDLSELKSYLEDETVSSAVVKSTSSVHCKGERFISTVKREAQHLIMAFERGIYPVSQCSTYDLKIKNTTQKK